MSYKYKRGDVRLSARRKIVLEEIRNMTPEELLKKYQMVIYSQEDIAKINRGLVLVQEVLNRNNNLLGKCDENIITHRCSRP